MIYWNREALEWQAEDLLQHLRGMIRESGADPKDLEAISELEKRFYRALDELGECVKELNGLDVPSPTGVRARLANRRATSSRLLATAGERTR